MIVSFMCQYDSVTGCPGTGLTIISGWAYEGTLDEISICIGRLNKTFALSSVSGHHTFIEGLNRTKRWKKGEIAFSLPDCLRWYNSFLLPWD